MESKAPKIIAVVAVLIIVLAFSWSHIKYFMSNGNDIIVISPETFYFYDISNDDYHDTISIYEGCNSGDCWYDSSNGIYHVFVDRQIFEDNQIRAYVTGKYYNYPFKPSVYLNDIKTNISTDNSGTTKDKIYFNKVYHFEMFCPIEPNEEYEIKVTCKNVSETAKIIFHESEESIPSSKAKNIVYYTINGGTYHANKNCMYLQNSEHIFASTVEYCGKENRCMKCSALFKR